MTRSIDKYLSLPTHYNDTLLDGDGSSSIFPTPVATTLPASISMRSVSDIDFGDTTPPSIPEDSKDLIASIRAKNTGVPGITVGQVLDIMLGSSGVPLFIQTIDESHAENTGIIQHHDDDYVFQFSGKMPPRIGVSALVRETYTHPHKTILHTAYEHFLRASKGYAAGYVALLRYGNWEYVGYMTSLRFGLSADTPSDYNTSFDFVALQYGQPGELIYGQQVTGAEKQESSSDNTSSQASDQPNIISGDL